MTTVWPISYRHLRLELAPVRGVQSALGRASLWILHLQPSECTGQIGATRTRHCVQDNLLPVQLQPFDPARQRVVLDLTALLASSDLGRDLDGAVGCASKPADPECTPILEGLKRISSGGHGTPVFHGSDRSLDITDAADR